MIMVNMVMKLTPPPMIGWWCNGSSNSHNRGCVVCTSGVINMAKTSKGRRPIEEVEPIINKIRGCFNKAGIIFEICGSIRRKHQIVGDIDIVVNRQIDYVVAALDGLEPVIIAQGDSKAEVIINGVYVDLVRSTLDEWGAAVCYLTGGKVFNIRLRGLAKKKGYKLNQHGLFNKSGNKVASMVEEDIFEALHEPYVTPDQRDNPSILD
jgi:DNA polymerase (family 10)